MVVKLHSVSHIFSNYGLVFGVVSFRFFLFMFVFGGFFGFVSVFVSVFVHLFFVWFFGGVRVLWGMVLLLFCITKS